MRTSKLLARILRHDPASVGLTLDQAGWVEVDSLLAALENHGHRLSRAQLLELVAASDKQRFALDPRTDRIRANQGHSLAVDLGLPPATPPARLYHGTPIRNLDSILAGGIDRGARHDVHLSADVETARRVGARRGRPVVLVVRARAMQADGHRFGVSANGVWLTRQVPARYLSRLGEAPAEALGETPAEALGETPAEALGEAPAEAPGGALGEAPGGALGEPEPPGSG